MIDDAVQAGDEAVATGHSPFAAVATSALRG